MKPALTSVDLHAISGVFFYDEQNNVKEIFRLHRMMDGAMCPRTHKLYSGCWCKPTLTYEDETGVEVWEHSYAC